MRQHTTTHQYSQNNPDFSFFRTADGVRLRTGFWQSGHDPCRGSIVVLNGRAEFLEKYAETAGELNQRGFDVFSFEWRGQGLSDRSVQPRTLGHVIDYRQYLADLMQIVRDVVLPRCRGELFLLGHSMGGHLALRYIAAKPFIPVVKMVLCAPMLGIYTRPFPNRWARFLCSWTVRRGRGVCKVPFSARSPYCSAFTDNCLTSDPLRFGRTATQLEDNPLLAIDGFSFSWLAATLASLAEFEHEIAQVPTHLPILLCSAGRDIVVCNDKIAAFASESPRRRLAVIAGARHEILQERDELRNQFWQLFDAFMAA